MNTNMNRILDIFGGESRIKDINRMLNDINVEALPESIRNIVNQIYQMLHEVTMVSGEALYMRKFKIIDLIHKLTLEELKITKESFDIMVEKYESSIEK